MMTANQIRTKFLEFFRSKGHSLIPSDSVVPKDDPTVLFTTAGMQQFKRQFLGQLDGYTRASTSQKCIRTDDLDEVGKTAFHHTFFEMLGNFSFGDYFKKEAITWGWEFLTKEMNIPAEKLWVSVYKDDDEAAKIWLEQIRIPGNKLVRLGDKSNFWPSDAKEKGPNGPCGPCSEIFFDYGVNANCPKGDKCDPDCNCGRFAEIWNLVFTQFNRKDGGVLEPLPAKNIDTGMGLERLCAVVQGKKNNFDTDLFTPIIRAIETHVSADLPLREKRVIADHIRAIVFAINDGVIPSNKERGFVVKGLINSATNIALSHGATGPTIYKLVPIVGKVMQQPYPEVLEKTKDIAEIVRKVEEAFIAVRQQRIPELKIELPKLKTSEARGELYFRYRDTFGLPLGVIIGTAGQVGFSAKDIQEDIKFYEISMAEQKNRSRASSKMTGDVFTEADLDLKGLKTIFCGYDQMTTTSQIMRIFKGTQSISQASQGDQVKIVLDQTPFYAESGGQTGDQGMLVVGSAQVKVTDTQKLSDVFLHSGEVIGGTIKINDKVTATVDIKRRSDIMRNHTATHLLQAALRQVLGTHVQQQGSVVDQERLRFDFTHPTGLTREQIQAIETYVFQAILDAKPVAKENLSLDEAKKRGALAFFAEKYGSTVRVITIDKYSQELCGGTHLKNTGEIGLFKIVSESAIAQGIRRIEAKTGWGAWTLLNEKEAQVQNLARSLKVTEADVVGRVDSLTNRLKQLEKECENYRFDLIKAQLDTLIQNAAVVNSAKIIAHHFADLEIGTLRKISDLIKQKEKTSAAVLGSSSGENAFILVTVSDDLVKKGMQANEIISQIAPMINGSGGGRPNMAQAGSKDTAKVKTAVEQAKTLIENKLKSI